MIRTRIYVMIPIAIMIVLSFGVTPAMAWYETSLDTKTAWVDIYATGKQGSMLQYGYSQSESHQDTHPQFYASMVSAADWGDNTPWYFIPRNLWIKVWGFDPLGNRLLPDRFTSLSVLVSPDESGAEILVLDTIWTGLLDVAPEGMLALDWLFRAGGDVYGAATERHTSPHYAQARYYNPLIWVDEYDSQRGMRFGYQLAVDPTLEGTYVINMEFKTYFWQVWNPYVPLDQYTTTTEQVTYTYDDPDNGGGGGCPVLSVYNGIQYADEGLLDIHANDDVTFGARLDTIPAAFGNKYYLRLTEHPMTISHIDSVQLFVRLEDGNIISLPLVNAVHSSDGNVKQELELSDDNRVDTMGATHNSGISEYIDLRFLTSPNYQITEFIFYIEGHNAISKT